MRTHITNPAPTLDEALAYTHRAVLAKIQGDGLKFAKELGEIYFECGAAWAAALVMREAPSNDRRAPSAACEKILAQVCPPAPAPSAATN